MCSATCRRAVYVDEMVGWLYACAVHSPFHTAMTRSLPSPRIAAAGLMFSGRRVALCCYRPAYTSLITPRLVHIQYVPTKDRIYDRGPIILSHCGRVTQICVFNTVKLGTAASSP